MAAIRRSTPDPLQLQTETEECVAVLSIAHGAASWLTVDGQLVAMDVADASTWVRRNGRWLCPQHSETIAGDPYGRDRMGGRADPLVNEILHDVNGLRSLLGIAESQ